jgi:pteridine reductase
MNVQNKIALVTGGTGRVGKTIALALAQSGAHVVITYNDSADETQTTLSEIRQLGAKVTAFPCNQAQTDSIKTLFVSLQNELDHLDILINSASIMERRPALDVTLNDWERVLNTNLRGPFFIAQAAAKWMQQLGNEGSIINVADLSALYPWPGYITHTISKSGIVAMTETLALALAPTIRVNAIAPGMVLKPENWGEERWRKAIAALPLHRSGSVEDIAQSVLFCIQSDFMTGQVVVLDGGRGLTRRSLK